MSDQSRTGKVFASYYVQCGVCREEVPLGTTRRDLVEHYLKSGGFERVRTYGYVCEQCRINLYTEELPEGGIA